MTIAPVDSIWERRINSAFAWGLRHWLLFANGLALLYAGLLFGLLRRRIKPAPLRAGGLLVLPMLLDGGTHLIDDLLGIGFRGGGDAIGTLNFWLRMLTGLLVGVTVLITLYPRLERDLRQPAAMVRA